MVVKCMVVLMVVFCFELGSEAGVLMVTSLDAEITYSGLMMKEDWIVVGGYLVGGHEHLYINTRGHTGQPPRRLEPAPLMMC
jgi:hypothetical protein